MSQFLAERERERERVKIWCVCDAVVASLPLSYLPPPPLPPFTTTFPFALPSIHPFPFPPLLLPGGFRLNLLGGGRGRERRRRRRRRKKRRRRSLNIERAGHGHRRFFPPPALSFFQASKSALLPFSFPQSPSFKFDAARDPD